MNLLRPRLPPVLRWWAMCLLSLAVLAAALLTSLGEVHALGHERAVPHSPHRDHHAHDGHAAPEPGEDHHDSLLHAVMHGSHHSGHVAAISCSVTTPVLPAPSSLMVMAPETGIYPLPANDLLRPPIAV